MSGTAHPSPDEADARLVAAFWRVVAARGWRGVGLRAVAAAAGLPAAEVRRRAPGGPADLLRLHLRVADAEVLAGTAPGQGQEAARDRIFDALMRRVDALQPHRAGLLRLLRDAPREPLAVLALAAGLPRSMAAALEAAGLDGGGPLARLLRAKGLGVVWLATLRAWARDDSADLGPTMTALDRALDRADQIARSLPAALGGAGPS